MGYRGKLAEQTKARELRAQGMLLDDIAAQLGVAKSSVSLWVRDVASTPSKRRYGARVRPNALMRRKQEEIDRLLAEGRERIGQLSDRDFLIAGVALYAAEGGKTQGQVVLPNSDARIVVFFCAWLRHFFAIDESRLRLRVYLHEDLDVDAATRHWEAITAIPSSQHFKPHIVIPRNKTPHTKHPAGCARIVYTCTRTHREIMGLVHALLTCDLPFRGSSIGRATDC